MPLQGRFAEPFSLKDCETTCYSCRNASHQQRSVSSTFTLRSSRCFLLVTVLMFFTIFSSCFQMCSGTSSSLFSLFIQNSPRPIQISSTLEVKVDSFASAAVKPCDTGVNSSPLKCQPVVFRFCVGQISPSALPLDTTKLWAGDAEQLCPLGRSVISTNYAQGALPLTETFSSPFSWPEVFSLIVDVSRTSYVTDHQGSGNLASSQAGTSLSSNDTTSSSNNSNEILDADSPAVQSSQLMRIVVQQKGLLPGGNWTVESSTTNEASMVISYRLRCASNMYGTTCTKYCLGRDSDFGHYTCDPITGDAVCNVGWTSGIEGVSFDAQKSSAINTGHCTTALCKSNCSNIGGYCHKPGECSCREGWTGEHCDVCRTKPTCKFGTCMKPGDCICDSKWTGENCDIPVNLCATSGQRCMENGGQCLNLQDGGYKCTCPFRRSGKDCDIVTSFCNSSPCLNGGTCIDVDETPGYICTCSSLSSGPNCEHLADRVLTRETTTLPTTATPVITSQSLKPLNSAVTGISVALMVDGTEKAGNSTNTSALTTTHLALIIAFGVIGPCVALLLIGLICALRTRRRRQQRQVIVNAVDSGNIPAMCAVAVTENSATSKDVTGRRVGAYTISARKHNDDKCRLSSHLAYDKTGSKNSTNRRPWSFNGQCASSSSAPDAIADNLHNFHRQQDVIDLPRTSVFNEEHRTLSLIASVPSELSNFRTEDEFSSTLPDTKTGNGTTVSAYGQHSGFVLLNQPSSSHYAYNPISTLSTLPVHTSSSFCSNGIYVLPAFDRHRPGHCNPQVPPRSLGFTTSSLLLEDGSNDLPPPYSPPSGTTLEDCV